MPIKKPPLYVSRCLSGQSVVQMHHVIFLTTSGIDSPKSESGQDGQHLPTLMVELCVPHEVDVGVPDRCAFGEDQG